MAVRPGAAARIPDARRATHGRPDPLRVGLELRSCRLGGETRVLDRRRTGAVVAEPCLVESRRRHAPAGGSFPQTGRLQGGDVPSLATGPFPMTGPLMGYR